MTKLLIALIAIAVSIFVGCTLYIYFDNKPVSTTQVGDAVANLPRYHIATDATHEPYNSNPPSSGPHYAMPEPWGIKNQPVVDEAVVHALEHGGVWISYQSGKLSESEVVQLTDIAKKYRKIILSPRPANDSLIAAVSWGRIQKFDHLDEDAINEFARLNRNHAPEKWANDTMMKLTNSLNCGFLRQYHEANCQTMKH